jgi:putative polymerase
MSSALPEMILIAAVCFNAVLAVINGHVVALARLHVVLAEIAVYAGALAIIVFRADRNMWPWFLLAIFIVLTGLLVSLGSGALNAKYIRDVMVIPVFIMLGMTYRRDTVLRPLFVVHSIVFLVAVVEVISPDTFSDLFRIIDYYVNTRDFSANAFWNGDSNLFLSATRPGERFFNFVDWHRLSSIFLEPVSLGNYCVVAAILIVACWHDMTIAMKSYTVGSNLFLLVGCDGRLATTSIGLVLVATIFARRISSRWSVVYLPAVILLAAGYVWFFKVSEVTDNFAGRVAGTVDALSRIDASDLLGLSASAADNALDNGIVYFIQSQSLVGVVVIWLSICLFARDLTLSSRLYVHAIAIFIPLNLLVSYSFFSIKVASLIWFFYGYLSMRDLDEGEVYSRGKAVAPVPSSALLGATRSR